jgi:GT2 family glycosyltransferase
MAAEQGYLLWLGHVIESLIGSTDSKRILVDYDRLMQSPDAELMRISRCLGLEIDPAELQSYKTQFLDNELRHTVYELNDLLLDNACPPIVREVYTALLDVASDKTMLDDKTLQNKVARWADEFERLKSPLLLADRLYTQKAAAMHAVTERDGQIASLNQSVTERDGQIASLNQSVTERDGQIASLNQSVTERDGQVISLNQAVIERDGQVISLNQEAAVRQSSYQCHVIELETAVGTEQQRYFLLTSEAANLRFQLKSIMESRSWNLTAPLRQLSTFAHKIPAALFRRAITIYRTLPITPLQRQKLKNLVFSIFGFAFARMGAYQRWKEYRHIQMDWPAKEQITKAAPVNSMIPGIIASLPSADGRWEWSDYNAVKSRISQIKSQQLSQVSPSPLDLINIGNESFSSVAARVKLPALIAEPVVSIILPVFNNLKLTLECLLSITAHTDSRVSYEIILADDASTDETAQIVGAIPNLRILRNESNLGFLLNCNKALEYAQGQYVMYLNNDVQVTKDWLFTLYETFATHPNVGAAGPRFLYPSGHLQEAGAAFRHDGTADMVGLNEEPEQPRYSYIRRVDYVSGACLMLPTSLARQLGGFSEDFLPCYCEDSDLCLRIQDAGYYVYCNPFSTVIHHLSKTTAAFDSDFKLKSISTNLVKLQHKWLEHFNKVTAPRIISFYLPQFHPFPENDSWWGNGFTEWTNVTKAQPNFVGHYQPRLPADLGFYDLRLLEIMQQQAELASRYGVSGFCFYYYWFGGKRLLETPLDQMLDSGKPDMPFCLCWANENWSRRWDGNDKEVLMAQSHSPEDDEAVISDLIRYFRDPRYICIDGKPLILIYRVTLFPNFSETATRWRNICREQGIGEIYIAMVESMEMVHANKHPKEYGCDAAVEFPPQELAEQKIPSGKRINPEFAGAVADYRDIAVRYATRKFPGYTRFKGVMPGWDNTARMQNKSFCFEHATPGALQAWLEETIEQTRQQHYGDERIVFVNAWNEWAEGAYLEPDRRFGHTYLEAVKNATEAANLLRRNKYWHGG